MFCVRVDTVARPRWRRIAICFKWAVHRRNRTMKLDLYFFTGIGRDVSARRARFLGMGSRVSTSRDSVVSFVMILLLDISATNVISPFLGVCWMFRPMPFWRCINWIGVDRPMISMYNYNCQIIPDMQVGSNRRSPFKGCSIGTDFNRRGQQPGDHSFTPVSTLVWSRHSIFRWAMAMICVQCVRTWVKK